MTLTRDKLLKLVPQVESIKINGFGDAYIRPQTELLRSRRMAAMFDKNGKPDFKEQMKSRTYCIVDQLCDKDGNLLFTEADIKEINGLDSTQLDNICDAIAEWNDARIEKKE